MTDKLKVIPFVKKEPTPNAAVVAMLEDLLARAKAGQIEAVVMVCIMQDGNVASAYTEHDEYFKVVGALEWLKMKAFAGVEL